MKTILLFLVLALSFNSHAQRKVLKKTEHYTIFVAGDSIKLNETGQLKFRVKLAKGHKFQKGFDHSIKNLKIEGLKIIDREIKLSSDIVGGTMCSVVDLNYTVKRTAKKVIFNGSIEFGIEGKPLQRVSFFSRGLHNNGAFKFVGSVLAPHKD